jgi:glutathione S-transferase
MEAVKQATEKFRWHMERLEVQISEIGGPWVCGDMFTLADICLVPIFDRIEYLNLENLWEGLPAVTQWYDKIRERDSYLESVHPFEYRMWGPKKSIEDYPYSEDDYPVDS